MLILGVGCSGHDFSSSLIADGKILVSIEEERLSKEKHGTGARSQLLRSVDYCLDESGFGWDDIDYIVSVNPSEYSSIHAHKFEKRHTINHHLAHCASAFYCSGFDEAACLVVDGLGTSFTDDYGEAISCYMASANEITPIDKILCRSPKYDSQASSDDLFDKWHSLGNFYSIITLLCGFSFLQEGKTMGLAPYGTDRYVNDFRKFVTFGISNGRPHFDFMRLEMISFGKELIRKEQIGRTLYEVKADIAYAGQSILEEILLELLHYLYNRTKCKKLAYSGGVALNSVFNGKIIKNTPFEQVFVFPAAGDSGNGIGAGLYWYYNVCKKPYIPRRLESVYLGKVYKEDEIIKSLEKHQDKLIYERLKYIDIVGKAAQALSEEHIIGWFQGRSEIGPRALGNRSILASPINGDMKDMLNSKIKFRESFRPFAPVVLAEMVHEYFETDFPDNPYMLFVANTLESKRNEVPAIVHVDGSARVQTVSRDDNEIYYNLVKEFYTLTGVPMLINTSFNIKGKPIVETPDDAVQSFLNCDMDDLFIYNYYIRKKH